VNVLKTAKFSAYTIALIAGVMSYGHQSTLLLDSRAGIYSYAVPLTVDVLAFISAMVRNSDQVDRTTRKAAAALLVLAGSMSIAANVAVGENVIQRIVGVWTVAAYLLAEWFVSRLKPAPEPAPEPVEVEEPDDPADEVDAEEFARRSEAAKRGAATRAANRAAKAKAERSAARAARRAPATAPATAADMAAIEALLAPSHALAEPVAA
jgi:hypothetical protein